VNIYEMYGDMFLFEFANRFLFEFPNRYMAEQVLQGQWSWKEIRFNLERWSPMGVVCQLLVTKKTWIRAVGIPLHLWSQKVFFEIGQLCGGWVATEEET